VAELVDARHSKCRSQKESALSAPDSFATMALAGFRSSARSRRGSLHSQRKHRRGFDLGRTRGLRPMSGAIIQLNVIAKRMQTLREQAPNKSV
jgi:hypothetical protein